MNDHIDTDCKELHIGNTPRSIMTKGTSTRRKNRLPGSLYGNFDPGNNDKLMITYRREPSHDYTMEGTCGVLFEGEMHFFGGAFNISGVDHQHQHFVIETQRSEQLVKMTKKEDLEIGLYRPECSTFEMTGEHFPWLKINVVILCFDINYIMPCFSFDGQLNYICDSNYEHIGGGLTKYKENLLTVSGYWTNQKTEILRMTETKNFSWSVVEPYFKFAPGDYICHHSLVTVESSDINEEYVLLIGGTYRDDDDDSRTMNNIFKFNGTWFPFGQLKKPRYDHNSIYWNGAVYVIGGIYDPDNLDWYDYLEESSFSYFLDEKYKNTKMEIWNIKDSPDQFRAKENWPELFHWEYPHLFIVPDSFFPDH